MEKQFISRLKIVPLKRGIIKKYFGCPESCSKEEIFFYCLKYALESDLEFFQLELELKDDMLVENTLYNLLLNYEKRLTSEVVSIFCL